MQPHLVELVDEIPTPRSLIVHEGWHVLTWSGTVLQSIFYVQFKLCFLPEGTMINPVHEFKQPFLFQGVKHKSTNSAR